MRDAKSVNNYTGCIKVRPEFMLRQQEHSNNNVFGVQR
jgi:hypothetical protein